MMAYSEPVSLWSFRDPALGKNLQLLEDLPMLLFNET